MRSLRFYSGDELGRIQSLDVSLDTQEGPKITSSVQDIVEKPCAVTMLKVAQDVESLVACIRSNASTTIYKVGENSALQAVSHWKHASYGPSFKPVSLDFIPGRGILTCATDGNIVLNSNQGDLLAKTDLHLPAKLKDLRISGDSKTIAVGGDEIELSTWDVEKTLASDRTDSTVNPPKKRKNMKAELDPGQVWKAQNVPNDNLNLRVPVHITTLCFLGHEKQSSQLLTGTNFGAIRRYDTRSKRRPISDWSRVVKKGGIVRVERGISDNDVFVTDERGGLFALDVRSGNQLYSYKGIGGTITSLAGEGEYILSASKDRYMRLHTTFSPPAQPGTNMEGRGEIIAKLYSQDVVNTVVSIVDDTDYVELKDDEEVGDEIWDELRDVDGDDDDDDDDNNSVRKKRRKVQPK